MRPQYDGQSTPVYNQPSLLCWLLQSLDILNCKYMSRLDAEIFYLLPVMVRQTFETDCAWATLHNEPGRYVIIGPDFNKATLIQDWSLSHSDKVCFPALKLEITELITNIPWRTYRLPFGTWQLMRTESSLYSTVARHTHTDNMLFCPMRHALINYLFFLFIFFF